MFAATEPRLCDADDRSSHFEHASKMEQVGAHDLALAERLIEYHPHKAAEILARIFKDDRIKNEANACFVPPPKNGQPEALRSPNRLELVLPARTPARSLSSHDSGSPPPPQKRRNRILDATPSMPSPPRAASSTGSRSTKGEAPPRDYILFTGVDEGGVLREKPVIVKTAPIPHSIIRDDVANRLDAEIDSEGEACLPIPHPEDPDLLLDVRVNSSTTLTWSRPRSDATHETRFYIVSRDLLMADVLLGYKDSGARQPGVYTRFRVNYISPLDLLRTCAFQDISMSLFCSREAMRPTGVNQHSKCDRLRQFRPHSHILTIALQLAQPLTRCTQLSVEWRSL